MESIVKGNVQYPLISLLTDLKPIGKVSQIQEHTSTPGNGPALYTLSYKALPQKSSNIKARLSIDEIYVIISECLCFV